MESVFVVVRGYDHDLDKGSCYDTRVIYISRSKKEAIASAKGSTWVKSASVDIYRVPVGVELDPDTWDYECIIESYYDDD